MVPYLNKQHEGGLEELEYTTFTQEPMVDENGKQPQQERIIVTQEPILLKIFVGTTFQTETTKTQEMEVQTEAENLETNEMEVQTVVETVEMQEVVVQNEEEEGMDHILDVQTQEAATQMEVAELQEIEEVKILNI